MLTFFSVRLNPRSVIWDKILMNLTYFAELLTTSSKELSLCYKHKFSYILSFQPDGVDF